MNERPTQPEDWECCESECSPCVWDTYYEALREWNAEQKAIKDALNTPQTKEQDNES
ncbi:hypothetical protein MGA5115_02131 [Marinomonas gallaica]|uniref:Oxidoreductase-like domain-containing protein n=1 Tax=Marinomonas gallaica TaxID=1806667 RepID=A0A1C3JS23_9GAMM|nr:oxidoreductase-like domain-containing protein [Marinomonas gallaica]SBT18013.1 hypothetical protein MGA5115_02131 [Marinomonas gallaica]SBT19879.1 hypothetical protein MGA5116_00462 [Marinomonas gallaica]